MATLAKNAPGIAGLRIDDKFGAANSGGDSAPTGTGLALLIKNGSGSPITVTMQYPKKYDGDQTLTGRAHIVTATTGEFAIPLRAEYADPATGLASWTYSGVTTLTVCVVQFP